MKLSAHRIPVTLLAAAASAWLALTFAPVFAQTVSGVWRCGNTYSDRPCDGGKAMVLDDARSQSQQREADAATRRTQAAADRMEKDRLRQEREAAGRQATYITKPLPHAEAATTNPSAHLRADASRRKKNRREPEHFTAAAAAIEKKK